MKDKLCKACNGTGQYRDDKPVPEGYYAFIIGPCESCDGTGVLNSRLPGRRLSFVKRESKSAAAVRCDPLPGYSPRRAADC